MFRGLGFRVFVGFRVYGLGFRREALRFRGSSTSQRKPLFKGRVAGCC